MNLLVYLIMLKFSLRGVLLRRIKDFAFHLNAFEITLKGIQDAILRVGAACKTVNPLHQPFTKDHHITLQSIKSKAITMLKVVILAMCFEGDITFIISELKAKSIVKGIYNLLSMFTVDQFVDMVLRMVNAVCRKRKSGKTIIIGDKLVLAIEYHSLKPLAFLV